MNNMEKIGPTNVGGYMTRRMYFTGSTAIKQGQPLVLDLATSTAPVEAQSGNLCKAPAANTDTYFVGVAELDYAAKTGGQWVQVVVPGSVAQIYTRAAVGSAGVKLGYAYTSGAPYFKALGTAAATAGKGVVVALGTKTILDTANSGGIVPALLLDGNDTVPQA